MKKLSLGFVLIMSGVLVSYVYSNHSDRPDVDLVVFSFDRPLQLYALLESTQLYGKGIQEQHVIYRASDDQFCRGYDLVEKAFSHVHFHKQGIDPRADFKPLTLKAAFDSSSPYIIFAVDDIVLKDTVDLSQCAQALEKYNAYGFYLRLGKNLTQCYPFGGRAQPLPSLKQEEADVFSWQFSNGQMDWAYPHTVDMTLYRKKDIEPDLRALSFYAPNKLEDLWHSRSRTIMSRRGLCYAASKIVNMPLNRVQHDYNNRAMSEYSSGDLLTIFIKGQKMDIAPLKCVDNKAAHMEYSPTFIKQ